MDSGTLFGVRPSRPLSRFGGTAPRVGRIPSPHGSTYGPMPMPHTATPGMGYGGQTPHLSTPPLNAYPSAPAPNMPRTVAMMPHEADRDLANRNVGYMGYGGMGQSPGYYAPEHQMQVNALMQQHRQTTATNGMSQWDRDRVALGQRYLQQAQAQQQLPTLPESSAYRQADVINGATPEKDTFVVPGRGTGRSSLISARAISGLGPSAWQSQLDPSAVHSNLDRAVAIARNPHAARQLADQYAAKNAEEFAASPAGQRIRDRKVEDRDARILANAQKYGLSSDLPAVKGAKARQTARNVALEQKLLEDAGTAGGGTKGSGLTKALARRDAWMAGPVGTGFQGAYKSGWYPGASAAAGALRHIQSLHPHMSKKDIEEASHALSLHPEFAKDTSNEANQIRSLLGMSPLAPSTGGALPDFMGRSLATIGSTVLPWMVGR